MALAAVAIGASLAVAGARARCRRSSRPAHQRPAATFRSSVDLVTVNVVVRDKNGNVVRGLTRDDFTSPRTAGRRRSRRFDFEEIATAAIGRRAGRRSRRSSAASAGAGAAPRPRRRRRRRSIDMHGRRADRAVLRPQLDAARGRPAVGGVGARLHREAADAGRHGRHRDALDDAPGRPGLHGRPRPAAADDRPDERRRGAWGSRNWRPPTPTDDTATAFSADDTEFTLFNTDRRLQAIQALIEAMAPIEQKKSLIYFSSGMTQSGIDNRVAIRTVIDRAVRSNVSIYAADIARPAGARAGRRRQPGEHARPVGVLGARGVGAVRLDVGVAGRADVDGRGHRRARLLRPERLHGGLRPRSWPTRRPTTCSASRAPTRAKDGRFRRIRVSAEAARTSSSSTAPATTRRATSRTREGRPRAAAAGAAVLRPVGDRPAGLRVVGLLPAEGRPLLRAALDRRARRRRCRSSKSSDKDKATLDVLAVVRDPQQRPVARIRDTINLSVSATEEVQRKNVQYQTDLELPPGTVPAEGGRAREPDRAAWVRSRRSSACRTSGAARSGSARSSSGRGCRPG